MDPTATPTPTPTPTEVPFVHSWPETRAPVVALVELQCGRCGYKMRWRAAKRPRGYDAMYADFLRKHTEEGCHDTKHEARS